jgi:hypothetical protein
LNRIIKVLLCASDKPTNIKAHHALLVLAALAGCSIDPAHSQPIFLVSNHALSMRLLSHFCPLKSMDTACSQAASLS